jgi:VanZ family protein
MFVFKSSLPLPMAMRWWWLDWPGLARWSVTLAYVVLVNWLLLAPGKTFRDIHLVLAYQDKVAHFGIFCVLTGLFCWSLPGAHGTWRKRILILLAMVGYGVAIECIQPLIPNSGRTFEWLDLLLDGIGVAAGLLACECLARQER